MFGKDLERIEGSAFYSSSLRRIVIPLKYGLIIDHYSFIACPNLTRVDVLDGGIHKTISSLHMESWRNTMEEEIDRINQTLPNTPGIQKAAAIRRWVARVIGRIEHVHMLVKEAMTLLELALWKAKLLNETSDEKKCNVDEVAKREHRVTCGASIVIKNVLPFLALK